ncbi:MAG: DUF4876 domain-containing protein [Calditrichia bacterium]
MKKIIFMIFISTLIFGSCGKKDPIRSEGNIVLKLFIADTTLSPFDQTLQYIPLTGSKVTLNSLTYNEKYTGYTNDSGFVTFEKVLSSAYTVHIIDTIHTNSASERIVSATLDLDLTEIADTVYQDTMIVKPVSNAGIVINEIFYSGSPGNYFYDQFIELYNPTNETQYLDAMILGRCSKDTATFGSAVKVLYAYQFPGEPGGNEYAIAPNQFVVIAIDALNHKDSTNQAPLNLENADWEFFTPFDDKPDYDNPSVPNVVNINENKDNEFLMNLKGGHIVLAQGDIWSIETDGYVYIPYTSIVDGVEYHSSVISEADDKYLGEDIDAGYTGVGVTRYEQQSVERIQPGYDTDNSTIDFKIISPPTPGY